MATQHETDLAALERTIKRGVADALGELAADGRKDWRRVAAEAAAADAETVALARQQAGDDPGADE